MQINNPTKFKVLKLGDKIFIPNQYEESEGIVFKINYYKFKPNNKNKSIEPTNGGLINKLLISDKTNWDVVRIGVKFSNKLTSYFFFKRNNNSSKDLEILNAIQILK